MPLTGEFGMTKLLGGHHFLLSSSVRAEIALFQLMHVVGHYVCN